MGSIKTQHFDGDTTFGRNISAGGDAEIQGSATVHHDVTVKGWLRAANIKIEGGGGGLTPEEREALDKLLAMFALDEENALLLVNGEKHWAVGMSEQLPVDEPLIELVASYITDNTARFRLTNRTSGAEMFYTTGAGEPTTSAGTGSTKEIAQTVAFADKEEADFNDASTSAFTVKALAKLNGVTSETATASLTVKRQAEAAACSASANYEFDTAPTFTIDKKGADEVRYTTDGSEPTAGSASYGSPFTLPQTITESVGGTAVTIRTLSRRKKGYADNTKSFAFTVGRCSAYIGALQTSVTVTASNIDSIRGQLTKQNSVLPTSLVTIGAGYLYFIVPKDRTITSIWQNGESLKKKDVDSTNFSQTGDVVGNYKVYVFKDKQGVTTKWLIK